MATQAGASGLDHHLPSTTYCIIKNNNLQRIDTMRLSSLTISASAVLAIASCDAFQLTRLAPKAKILSFSSLRMASEDEEPVMNMYSR